MKQTQRTKTDLGNTMRSSRRLGIAAVTALAAACLPGTLSAQDSDIYHVAMMTDDGGAASAGGQPAATDSSDKTGTNPINFSFDARVYNEYQWLNTAGDGSQNITTFEFRAPFADGKWQFRTRLRATGLKADFDNDGRNDVDEWGFGDMDFRLLTVPYMNTQKKFAIATGLEVFLNTASHDALGSNAISLGPQVFAVFFQPFGGMFDLIAPAYQHKFSVYEESGANNVHQGFIDVFALKTSADKKKWALINPTAIFDYENDIEFLTIDLEAGMMLDDLLGTKGHSVYLRPSVAVGSDRPYDYSVECGYKIIW